MADLQLDTTTDDLFFDTDGDLNIIAGQDAIRQDIELRLRTFLGEWFLDERIGIPYYEQILIKNPNFAAVQSLLRRTVETTAGVVAIDLFEMDFEAANRRLTVTLAARTVGDDVPLTFDTELILP